MIQITYSKLLRDVDKLAQKVEVSKKRYDSIFGVPRGGVPIAILLAKALNRTLLDNVNQISSNTLIVDDLIDSGKTREQFKDNEFAVVYTKPHSPKPTYSVEAIDGWIRFPYEETEKDEQDIIVRLLEVLGEDPTREGLQDTPKRVIKFYKEFLEKKEFNFTTFEGEQYDEMIVQRNIPFFSLCEHHIAPFFGTATVAYIPTKRIVGLSKLARCIEHYTHNLQNQERITSQVAERLNSELGALGVAVSLSARHFCMEMRGVKTHDVYTTTTKLLGVFKENNSARAEFMTILKG